MTSACWSRRVVLAVALLTPACDSAPAEPPDEFPFAAAMRECGPADGPAVAIYLLRDTMPALPPGGPHVRIYIWHDLDQLRARAWAVGQDSPDGWAVYQDGIGTTTNLHGTVTVTGVGVDSTVRGEVELMSRNAFAVRGGFRAPWVPRTLLCG